MGGLQGFMGVGGSSTPCPHVGSAWRSPLSSGSSFTVLDVGNYVMLNNIVSRDMNLEGEKVDINFSAEGYHSSDI